MKNTMRSSFYMKFVTINAVALLFFTSCMPSNKQAINADDNNREPIILYTSGLVARKSIDDMISEASIIAIGTAINDKSSWWNTGDGKLPPGITNKNITFKYHIYTDMGFTPTQILKGENSEKSVKVRTMGGIVGKDKEINEYAIKLIPGETYLLFLFSFNRQDLKNIKEANGAYFVSGGPQGCFHIEHDHAISINAEWLLNDLISYINQRVSPSATETFTITPSVSPTIDVPASPTNSYSTTPTLMETPTDIIAPTIESSPT